MAVLLPPATSSLFTPSLNCRYHLRPFLPPLLLLLALISSFSPFQLLLLPFNLTTIATPPTIAPCRRPLSLSCSNLIATALFISLSLSLLSHRQCHLLLDCPRHRRPSLLPPPLFLYHSNLTIITFSLFPSNLDTIATPLSIIVTVNPPLIAFAAKISIFNFILFIF